MNAQVRCPLCTHSFWFDATKVSASVGSHALYRPTTPDDWLKRATDMWPTCTRCGQKIRVDNPLRTE